MRRIVSATLVSLALTACGGTPDPEPSATATTTDPTQRPSSPAVITVVEPVAGATIEGPDVPVKVELENATVIEEVTTELSPDEGHIHIALDGKTITLLAGLEETVPNVPPGPHLLEVEFVAGDHGPFNPRVVRTVSFTVA